MILVGAGSPDSIKRLSEIAHPITEEGRIVVAGFSDVGSKLVEMLTDAEEDVCAIDQSQQPAVEVVGDVLDTGVPGRAGVATARVIILSCENDSATLLAASVVRDYAPMCQSSPARPWKTMSGVFNRREPTLHSR